MKISTKGRYALEALTYMASLDADSPVSILEIAGATQIPQKYLEQIFFSLRKSGLLSTKRGPTGGYQIACDSKELTAGTIVRAVEGDITPVACLQGKEFCNSEIYSCCVTRVLWGRIYGAVDRVLDHVTLYELAEGYKEKQKQ